MLGWFDGREAATGLRVVRVKNKFGFRAGELLGGYRDLMISVLYRADNGLAIIGEIQERLSTSSDSRFFSSFLIK